MCLEEACHFSDSRSCQDDNPYHRHMQLVTPAHLKFPTQGSGEGAPAGENSSPQPSQSWNVPQIYSEFTWVWLKSGISQHFRWKKKMKTDHKELSQELWKWVQLPLPALCPKLRSPPFTRTANTCLQLAAPWREGSCESHRCFLSPPKNIAASLSSISRDKSSKQMNAL